jgi:phosphoenolpyruvate synthase/pyruvate phosphate dikinase
MSKPDMFIIEWGNRLLKRIEMPWIKVIKERHLKLAKKTQYLKVFNPSVDALFDVIESNKELYVESNEMWGCKYEYFVIKNVYVLNMFKEQNLCKTTKYEIHVTLNNLSIKGNTKLIFELDTDENINEAIGARLLELFID